MASADRMHFADNQENFAQRAHNPMSSITLATSESVVGWLCVRPRDSEAWQHQCAVLDSRGATLTFRTSPPEFEGSRIERVVRLGPGTACFPTAEPYPGLYTFALRTPDTGYLLLGASSHDDTQKWLFHLQLLCKAGEGSSCSSGGGAERPSVGGLIAGLVVAGDEAAGSPQRVSSTRAITSATAAAPAAAAPPAASASPAASPVTPTRSSWRFSFPRRRQRAASGGDAQQEQPAADAGAPAAAPAAMTCSSAAPTPETPAPETSGGNGGGGGGGGGGDGGGDGDGDGDGDDGDVLTPWVDPDECVRWVALPTPPGAQPMWREDVSGEADGVGGVEPRAVDALTRALPAIWAVTLEVMGWTAALMAPRVGAVVWRGSSDGASADDSFLSPWPLVAAAVAALTPVATALGLCAVAAEVVAELLRRWHETPGAMRSVMVMRGAPSEVFGLMMRVDSSRYKWDGAYELGRVERALGPTTELLTLQLRPPPRRAAPPPVQLARQWQSSPRHDAWWYTACSVQPPGATTLPSAVLSLSVTVSPHEPPKEDTATPMPRGATAGAAGTAGTAGGGAWSLVSMVVELRLESGRFRRLLTPWTPYEQTRWMLSALPSLADYLRTSPPLEPFAARVGSVPAAAATAAAAAAGSGGSGGSGDGDAANAQQQQHLDASTLAAAAAAAAADEAWQGWGAEFALQHSDACGGGDGGGGGVAKHAWSEPPADIFKVRGQHYLDDKVKRPSASCAFSLRRALLIPARDKLHHLMASRRHQLPPRPAGAPLCFVIVFQVPGTPRLHLVLLFERNAANDADVDRRDLHAFEELMRRTTAPETVEQLKGRLKIVPNLAEGGGFVVRKTVGNKPAIISNALSQNQYIGDGYVEVDIDVEVSAMAQYILGVVRPLAAALVIDLAFVIEGQDEVELPERLLGGVRLHRINLKEERLLTAPPAEEE